jgi:hypothetical protein
MLALAVAVSSSHLPAFAALVGFGFALGIVGHLVGSRTMIVTGILVIAVVTSYYVFVLQPAK